MASRPIALPDETLTALAAPVKIFPRAFEALALQRIANARFRLPNCASAGYETRMEVDAFLKSHGVDTGIHSRRH